MQHLERKNWNILRFVFSILRLVYVEIIKKKKTFSKNVIICLSKLERLSKSEPIKCQRLVHTNFPSGDLSMVNCGFLTLDFGTENEPFYKHTDNAFNRSSTATN